MVLDFFYLESQPQPSLGKLEEADFTLRVGYLVRFSRPPNSGKQNAEIS